MKFKIFKIIFLIAFLLNTQFSYGEILKPNTSILPSEVVKIQLNGLQQNNLPKEDFGIIALLVAKLIPLHHILQELEVNAKNKDMENVLFLQLKIK